MKKSQDFVEKFSTILQKQGTISAKRAEEFKKLFKQRSKATFVDFLQEEGFVERKDLLNALSTYYEKPAFDVVGHFFDEHYVHMFPVDVMVRNVFIPLEREENVLVVVAGDPANEQLLPLIGNYVSYDIRFNVGLARDIIDAAREFSEYSIAEYPEMIDVGIKKEEQEANEVRRLVLEEEEQD
jgi:hypothetical protein